MTFLGSTLSTLARHMVLHARRVDCCLQLADSRSRLPDCRLHLPDHRARLADSCSRLVEVGSRLVESAFANGGMCRRMQRQARPMLLQSSLSDPKAARRNEKVHHLRSERVCTGEARKWTTARVMSYEPKGSRWSHVAVVQQPSRDGCCWLEEARTNKQVKDLSRPDQSRGPRLCRFVVQPPVA